MREHRGVRQLARDLRIPWTILLFVVGLTRPPKPRIQIIIYMVSTDQFAKLTVSANTANLHRLCVLRIIAIVGQIGAVALAITYFDLPVPLAPLCAIVGGLAVFNVATWLWLRHGYQATTRGVFLQLLVDVAALTGLLYFSGGATNPFVFLYLLPLTIAATAVPGHYTWALVAVTIACYSLLMVFFVPLPQEHSHDAGFGLHVFGMWFGFVLGAALIGYFVVGMGSTLRRQERALAEAREQALRSERLVACNSRIAASAFIRSNV